MDCKLTEPNVGVQKKMKLKLMTAAATKHVIKVENVYKIRSERVRVKSIFKYHAGFKI